MINAGKFSLQQSQKILSDLVLIGLNNNGNMLVHLLHLTKKTHLESENKGACASAESWSLKSVD